MSIEPFRLASTAEHTFNTQGERTALLAFLPWKTEEENSYVPYSKIL